ncbi:hypothetical protein, conserved [Eimeria maxima]|uniref:Phosphatidate cytidylyltransferase, mitochondrial n=1 Tax=Eimeria maxima TaxID=5804 RepID=U6MC68_EIMMA|nr:hypothetical protein, conserved [Eimeria maxima]CDJ61832.1 hypothetical protein, conserved [Eimeria maxima]
MKYWPHMYMAGRMQKPVSISWWGDTAERRKEFDDALETNRRNALRLALLLLPEEVTLECLLKEIVSLSYRGDFRVLFAEDPNKAKAIVNGQGDALCSIYLPLLSEIPSVHLEVEGGPLCTGEPSVLGEGPLLQRALQNPHALWGPLQLRRIRVRQDRSPAALAALYEPLPLSLRQRAEAVSHHPLRSFSGFFCRPLERPRGGPIPAGGQPVVGPPSANALRLGLQQLVFGPTLKCSLKNAVSAGLGASVLYSMHKIRKRLGL